MLNNNNANNTVAAALINIGRISGNKRQAHHETTMNHFMKYLRLAKSEFSSFDEMPVNLVVDLL